MNLEGQILKVGGFNVSFEYDDVRVQFQVHGICLQPAGFSGDVHRHIRMDPLLAVYIVEKLSVEAVVVSLNHNVAGDLHILGLGVERRGAGGEFSCSVKLSGTIPLGGCRE